MSCRHVSMMAPFDVADVLQVGARRISPSRCCWSNCSVELPFPQHIQSIVCCRLCWQRHCHQGELLHKEGDRPSCSCRSTGPLSLLQSMLSAITIIVILTSPKAGSCALAKARRASCGKFKLRFAKVRPQMCRCRSTHHGRLCTMGKS